MVTINTNISALTAALSEKLGRLADRNYLPRLLASGVIDKMTTRIHNKGGASTGGPIGTYSTGYLALRQQKFARSGDMKVIVSLTRQLENDWAVLATPKGFGIGFKNPFNKKKMKWVEYVKAVTIAELDPSELTYIEETAQQLVTDALT